MHRHGPSSAFESETFGEDLSFHIEQPVGSMSISPCGRDVVLASKEGLHVIDLDSPYSPPRYLPHRTPWEVADVQWSPFGARDFWIISTSNQKALVWNLGARSWQDSVEFVLHGHSRAITDINFSAHHPEVLATCAVDSFVHCWDLRVPARPVVSFSDWFAGATQVKWSRQVSHVIASSHDKYLRIWDDRMGATPVRSIKAHDTKIYGIDWNRQQQHRIVTCSLDRSIKFWDSSNLDDVPERVINTPFPAWRARHTPFGWGLLAMPQRGNGDLHLYDRRSTEGQHTSGPISAVARFHGHKGQVKEFLWRPRGTIVDDVDHREFQLVSWGTDQELRLHRMNPETLSAVGYEKGATQISRLNVTRSGARYKSFRDGPSDDIFNEAFDSQVGSSSGAAQSFPWCSRRNTNVGMRKVAILHPQGWLEGKNGSARIGMHGKADARRAMNPIDWMKNVKITSWNSETLGEEISQVGEKFAKVSFESVDLPRRKAVISMNAPWGDSHTAIFMKIDIRFPTTYPAEAAAVFRVQRTAAMTDELAEKLSAELRTIAETYVARKRGCLEAVLRYLLREQIMEQIVSWILDESLESSKIVDDVNLNLADDVSSDEDDVGIQNFPGPSGLNSSLEILNANLMVPVPNSCGAQWADNGKLVCFFQTKSREPTSFLGLLSTQDGDVDKGDKFFEGFGKLRTDSPGARAALRTATSAEDQSSDFSDDSSFSSSSSSASSDNLVSLPTQFFPRNAWRAGGGLLHRSKSTEYSVQSALGASKRGNGVGSIQNVVSINEMNDLMPSKQSLALEYIIYGKASDVCRYNAEVAMRHGYQDIAHIWRLIMLILQDNVPLQRISIPHASSDVVTIARSAADTVHLEGRTSRLDTDGELKQSRIEGVGRVRWGESAFGGRYLVPALISYFERLGDVQMLAMLSCVLAEKEMPESTELRSRQDRQSQSTRLSPRAFAVEYHPSLEVARSIMDKSSFTSFSSVKSSGKGRDPDKLTATETVMYGDSTAFGSIGTTPLNLSRRLSRGSREGKRISRLPATLLQEYQPTDAPSISYTAPLGLSTSPEEARTTQRSSSNATFSESRAGNSTLGPTISQSPPNVGSGSEKMTRSSPVGSFLAHHMNTGGRSAASIFGGAGKAKQEFGTQTTGARRSGRPVPISGMAGRPPSISFDGETLERARSGSGSGSAPKSASKMRASPQTKKVTQTSTKQKIKIKSTLHNQSRFDNDGYASVPLLDPTLQWKYRGYRAKYAHLLGVWNLQIRRAEMLKFGGLSSGPKIRSKGTVTEPAVEEGRVALDGLLRRRNLNIPFLNMDAEPQQGLEIRRRCIQCSRELTAVEKNGVPIALECAHWAASRKQISTGTLCVICNTFIAGLMVPCLSCGHVTCFGCQRKWLARENKTASEGGTDDEPPFRSGDASEKPCATGCGCMCSSYECVSISIPPSTDNGVETEDQPDESDSYHDFRSLGHDRPSLYSQPNPDPTPPPASNAETVLGAFLSRTARGRSASDRGSLGRSTITPSSNSNQPIDTDMSSTSSNNNLLSDSHISDHRPNYSTISTGLRAGLTRTAILREQASNATIRKRSESEARSQRPSR